MNKNDQQYDDLYRMSDKSRFGMEFNTSPSVLGEYGF